MAIEIGPEGPRIISVKQLLQEQVYIEAYQCKIDVWPAIRSMRDDLGSGYDFLGLFWNIVRLIIYGIFRLEILKPVHFISKWFCSEFCSEILIRSQIPGTEDWRSSDISPADLRKLYSKSDHFEYVFYPSF